AGRPLSAPRRRRVHRLPASLSGRPRARPQADTVMRFKSPPPLVSPRSCECKSTLDTSDGVFEGWTISTDGAEKAPLTTPCSDRDYCDLSSVSRGRRGVSTCQRMPYGNTQQTPSIVP